MTSPKRHRPGWLTNVFCSTVAVMALGTGATTAFAQDNAAGDAVPDLDAAKITQMAQSNTQTTMPQVVVQACSGADIVLVGDTDHTSLPAHLEMSSDGTLDAMAECGVGVVFIELSSAFQGQLDKFQSGEITIDALRSEYETFVNNFHKMDEDDYAAKIDAEMQMFVHAKDLGLRVIAADPQNGAIAGSIHSMLHYGAFKALREGLAEENRPYYDLYMDNRDSEIPADRYEQFKQDFAKIYQGEKVQHLLAKADEYAASMEERRKNDTQLADNITGVVAPGDKAVVLYGQGHFTNNRTDGLDSILNDRGYKVSRVDVFETADAIGYKPGEDLPQHVYVVDTQMSLTLKPQQQAAPAPQPAKGIKAEM